MSDCMEDFPVWAEIDLAAVAHNVRELRRATRPAADLMAVVKANGYGHGAVEISRQALANGAAWLGVARLDEAEVLREAGIEAPILLFGPTPRSCVRRLRELNLTQTVFSLEYARTLSEAAGPDGGPVRVHIKIDTGMGRLGLLDGSGVDCAPDRQRPEASERDLARQVEAIVRLPGLHVEGLYTHFAGSDLEDKTFARHQLARFLELAERLRRLGIEFRHVHAANSAALLDLPDSHLDLVRPGIALYGLYPSAHVDRSRVALKPALTLKARIVQLKEVPAGFKVSYGMTYETHRPTRIATVSVGYADGLRRSLGGRGFMLVRGVRAPIVGRVCMDLTMLDVGDIGDLRTGDEVIVFGGQGTGAPTTDEIASELGTISYEIVTSIPSRVPRVYLRPEASQANPDHNKEGELP